MLKDCVSERNRSSSATQKALGAAAENQEVARKCKFVRTSIRPLQAKRQVRFYRQMGIPASVSAFPPRRERLPGRLARRQMRIKRIFIEAMRFLFSLPLINDFPLSRALNLCVFWQTNLGANQFCTVKMEIMTFCGFSLQRGNRIYSLVRGDACRYSPSTICKWQNLPQVPIISKNDLSSCPVNPLSLLLQFHKKKKKRVLKHTGN